MFSLFGVKRTAQLADPHQAWRYAATAVTPVTWPSLSGCSPFNRGRVALGVRGSLRPGVRTAGAETGPPVRVRACGSEARGVRRAVTRRPGAGGALGTGGDGPRLASGLWVERRAFPRGGGVAISASTSSSFPSGVYESKSLKAVLWLRCIHMPAPKEYSCCVTYVLRHM